VPLVPLRLEKARTDNQLIEVTFSISITYINNILQSGNLTVTSPEVLTIYVPFAWFDMP